MSNNRLSGAVAEVVDERATRASQVASDLRSQIMAGTLPPEAHLRVQALSSRYNVALSPVREALNRLSSEGLVEARDMRGFFVAPVSADDLDELTRTRCWLNETALRQSMATGGQGWEERVLLAFHRLSRLQRAGADGAVNAFWTEAHRAFHRALTDGCGSRHLVGYCDQLFVQAERYRNLSRMAPDANAARRDDEHRAIMDAVLAGDADDAVARLNAHFAATAALCHKVLQVYGGRA